MTTNKLQEILTNSAPNAFICYNTEHVLTSLILSYYFQNKNYIYICNRFSGYRQLAKKINNQYRFTEKALAIDDNNLKDKNMPRNPLKKIIRLLFYKKHLRNLFSERLYIKPLKTSDIFLYNDGQFLSQYIVTNFDNLYLLEEGIGNYASIHFSFASILKKLHGIYPPYGRNPRIKNIFVKRPQMLPSSIRHKGSYFNKTRYTKNIPKNIRSKLVKIFLDQTSLQATLKNSALLITQPFSEDLVISEEKKLDIYEEIVDQLSQQFAIYIKPHPREKTDYSFFNSRVEQVFDNIFPIEIINYMQNIHFKIAVTLSSSAISRLNPKIETYELGDILSDDEKYFREIKNNLHNIIDKI
ncbi:MAG: glycosyltransferase family 52 protein [Candidatus Marinimicrobia bacterium]|nr:glycosyltransferase family 52 protein [Candidatus Neomarinimicrobiota bacterium]